MKALFLVAMGALLVAGVALGDLWLDGGRLVSAGLGRTAPFEACTAQLVRQLAEKGFEPDDVEFGPAPRLGLPWGRDRSLADSFTFLDGAAEERVDGVVACLVSGGHVTVDFRVASKPHRAA